MEWDRIAKVIARRIQEKKWERFLSWGEGKDLKLLVKWVVECTKRVVT